MNVRIDELDRKILSELQRDAGQSLDEIASRVGSSKTPVWNRIRKMRDAGVVGWAAGGWWLRAVLDETEEARKE